MSIEEIIAALERAQTPSSLLDAEIDCAVRFRDLRPALPTDFDGKYGYYEGNIKVEHGFLQARRYTSSLDAALTLVPEGWLWRARSYSSGVNFGATLENDVTGVEVEEGVYPAPSHPAIALCLAALRARSIDE